MKRLFQVIEPTTPQDWEAYFNLRYQILRAPWQQPRGSERDNKEDQSLHALAVSDSGLYLGCGRSEKLDLQTIQIRYMAVSEAARGWGVGQQILHFLENRALLEGIQKVVLHARENALAFYLKQGYETIEKSHILFNEIQHYLMKKNLR